MGSQDGRITKVTGVSREYVGWFGVLRNLGGGFVVRLRMTGLAVV
jgi:hypothetical protein